MRHQYRWFLAVLALGLCADATAQIYACTAPNGTRIYSDERCGSDAKVITGVTSKKRPAAKTPASSSPASSSSPPRPAPSQKSAAELDALLKQCDAGKVAACNDWTRSGGPNRLREQERLVQVACEAGSLAACEERYCSDGAGPQCRSRVLQTAKLAGETWYLRDGNEKRADGATRYAIRCIWEGVRTTRDVNVTCAAKAGPQRCSDAEPDTGFAQLATAAASYCAQR